MRARRAARRDRSMPARARTAACSSSSNALTSRAMNLEAERERLEEDARRVHNWRRWGPYLPDRQWGTVREDYSDSGEVWTYLSHDHARSRAYRWGDDGLLGLTDREC